MRLKISGHRFYTTSFVIFLFLSTGGTLHAKYTASSLHPTQNTTRFQTDFNNFLFNMAYNRLRASLQNDPTNSAPVYHEDPESPILTLPFTSSFIEISSILLDFNDAVTREMYFADKPDSFSPIMQFVSFENMLQEAGLIPAEKSLKDSAFAPFLFESEIGNSVVPGQSQPINMSLHDSIRPLFAPDRKR